METMAFIVILYVFRALLTAAHSDETWCGKSLFEYSQNDHSVEAQMRVTNEMQGAVDEARHLIWGRHDD
jgi:hypothetical protein